METAQQLLHAVGEVLLAEILEYDRETHGKRLSDRGAEGKRGFGKTVEQARIEKFMRMMHDFGKRILTPGEDIVCTNF
jgi:hypothetical protein